MDLGRDNPLKLLLHYSMPAMVGQLVNAIYNLMDRVFVLVRNIATGVALVLIGILAIVSFKGSTICPRFALLDSANSFCLCFSMSSVADAICAVTFCNVSSNFA